MKAALSAVVVWVVVVNASQAYADPVRIVAGSVQIAPLGDADLTGALIGRTFDERFIVYGDETPVGLAGVRLSPGEAAVLSGVVNFRGGLPFREPFDDSYSGRFTFSSSSAAFPCSEDEFGTFCSATAPFTFTGVLSKRDVSGQLLWDRHLVGRGTASGMWFNYYRAVTYTFAADPVPEPHTLMLFGLGLAGGCCTRWARARRRTASSPGTT
jgi:hypothetical protein